MIENRVRFDRRWSAQEKASWCRDTHDYFKCAQSFITDCSARSVAAEVTQLSVFLEYIEKAANRECPGGLQGCTIPFSNGSSCIDRVAYFLEQNARENRASNTNKIFSILLFALFLLRSLTI